MRSVPPTLPELSPTQREIMAIIWSRGEITATQLRDAISATRSVSRNTVRTLIERMEAKGWITHREEGRTFIYSAARARPATIGQKVAELIDGLCDGAPERLVSALLDYRGLSGNELKRIREMLDQAKAARKSRKGE